STAPPAKRQDNLCRMDMHPSSQFRSADNRPPFTHTGGPDVKGRFRSLPHTASEKQSPDQKQDDGADKGDDDLVQDRDAEVDRDVQHPGEPATEDRAEDADDDVPEPTSALAHDDTTGEEPRDQAHDEVDDYVLECHGGAQASSTLSVALPTDQYHEPSGDLSQQVRIFARVHAGA